MPRLEVRHGSDIPGITDALVVDEPLSSPELGYRGVMSLMNDLSKAVSRLKDDLFVIRFKAPINDEDNIDDYGVGGGDGDGDDDDSDGDGGHTRHHHAYHNDDNSNGGKSAGKTGMELNQGAIPTSVAPGNGYCSPTGDEVGAGEGEPVGNVLRASPPSKVRTKGRMPVQTKQTAQDFLIKGDLSSHAAALTRGIVPDTSDPDGIMSSPFVDSRHTFLEMCQYRHYQFDTLRRAKHSSLQLLYHLHNPNARHIKPLCSMCGGVMNDVRWHCEQCQNFDVCKDCASNILHKIGGKSHEHDLTPVRVTFP
jgi:hypothetical protein